MWNFHTLAHTSLVILNSIVLSLQFECLPNGAPIPGFRHSDAYSSAPGTQDPPAGPYSLNNSLSLAEPHLRQRSRSPPEMNRTSPTKLPFSNVLGYGLDQLAFIRLIPYKNPKRQFELRKYTFPPHKPIELLGEAHTYRPIPNQEQIVVVTLEGDVFAILRGTSTLAGIYTYNHEIYFKVRSKINIRNGKVKPLTADEIRETPVGQNRQILHGYRVENLNQNHGPLAPAETPIGSRSSSSSRHMALPTRVPSSDGSGYGLDQLQFIRITPNKNPNQIFVLRRYTFPADKLILFLEDRNHFEPIPIHELLVLTTDSGDVFAILGSNNDLAGIYTYIAHTRANVRVKMNMRSGEVTQLTKNEIMEVPLGRLRPILLNFKIRHLDRNPPRQSIN